MYRTAISQGVSKKVSQWDMFIKNEGKVVYETGAVTLRPKHTNSPHKNMVNVVPCLSYHDQNYPDYGSRLRDQIQITDPDYGSGITDLGLRIQDYGSGLRI